MSEKIISWELIQWNKQANKFYERKGTKYNDDTNIIHLQWLYMAQLK